MYDIIVKRNKKDGVKMSEKIMIIDDEPDIIFLLRDFFVLNDYEVITADSAEDASE